MTTPITSESGTTAGLTLSRRTTLRELRISIHKHVHILEDAEENGISPAVREYRMELVMYLLDTSRCLGTRALPASHDEREEVLLNQFDSEVTPRWWRRYYWRTLFIRRNWGQQLELP
ncbi:hypothetical protein HDK77DRAFT_486804 [Phyllosticta capitalensis]